MDWEMLEKAHLSTMMDSGTPDVMNGNCGFVMIDENDDDDTFTIPPTLSQREHASQRSFWQQMVLCTRETFANEQNPSEFTFGWIIV
jgi:hypothetical protein